jgi:RNA polymerase sigma-70 factor (ECF subfamily)
MSPPTAADRDRFEALYRRHYPAVARYARRRTDAATADDVVAETFTVAWRRLDRVPDDALPWLLRVSSHELSTRRRRDRSDGDKARLAGVEADRAGRDPADAVGEREAVISALGSLSRTDCDALLLVAWDGLSLADGARVAGVTRLAFAMRVSRARRRLAAALRTSDAPLPTPILETTR